MARRKPFPAYTEFRLSAPVGLTPAFTTQRTALDTASTSVTVRTRQRTAGTWNVMFVWTRNQQRKLERLNPGTRGKIWDTIHYSLLGTVCVTSSKNTEQSLRSVNRFARAGLSVW